MALAALGGAWWYRQRRRSGGAAAAGPPHLKPGADADAEAGKADSAEFYGSGGGPTDVEELHIMRQKAGGGPGSDASAIPAAWK